ncbi:MAG: HEPN domain-containing protein [Nitrospirae bacterium]|nr:HEPN domain-containing protein [Nitrospirota bacterium]
MNNEKITLISYRLSQSKESMKEAETLLVGGMSFRSVMNRLYYSMFYVVLALLSLKGLSSSKHFGIISLFDKEFIKTGIFEKELSKALHRAFELRQIGDYLEQKDITQEDIDEIKPAAQNFVDKYEKYIVKNI